MKLGRLEIEFDSFSNGWGWQRVRYFTNIYAWRFYITWEHDEDGGFPE